MTASTQSGGKSQSKSSKSNLNLRNYYLIGAHFCYKKTTVFNTPLLLLLFFFLQFRTAKVSSIFKYTLKQQDIREPMLTSDTLALT